MSNLVAIGLGSNLGDRVAHLRYAVSRLQALLTDVIVSSFIETDPLGVDPQQPLYVNAVVVGRTTAEPHALLRELQAIERERLRERPFVGAPRTLDLDLVLFADSIIEDAALKVPHPRFRERFFVLGPLAEIAPHLVDPVTGLTMVELLKQALAKPG